MNPSNESSGAATDAKQEQLSEHRPG